LLPRKLRLKKLPASRLKRKRLVSLLKKQQPKKLHALLPKKRLLV